MTPSLHPHEGTLCCQSSSRRFLKINVSGAGMELPLHQRRAMERHRRNLLKGSLESLSQRDLSNNRPGRLLNKLPVPFQHPLARSIATQSSLAFLFLPSWQAEYCVCSSAQCSYEALRSPRLLWGSGRGIEAKRYSLCRAGLGSPSYLQV